MFIIFMSVFSIFAILGFFALVNGFFSKKIPVTVIYTEYNENDTEYDIHTLLSQFYGFHLQIIINGESGIAHRLAKDFPNIKMGMLKNSGTQEKTKTQVI